MNLFRPTPLPHLTCKRSIDYHHPPPITYPLFSGKFRQSSFFLISARPSLVRASNIDSPSELRQHWTHRAVHDKKDDEDIVLCHEELHKIVKLLASIMPNVSAEKYYRCLAEVLKKWHTDIQEQEQHSPELSTIGLLVSWIYKFFSFIGDISSWSCGPWFGILLVLCAIGVVLCSVLFPGFLIWKCCARKPDPPPSPPSIDSSLVLKLLPFSSFISSFNPSAGKNLLPCSFGLATLAVQLKIFIPMIMAAAAKM